MGKLANAFKAFWNTLAGKEQGTTKQESPLPEPQKSSKPAEKKEKLSNKSLREQFEAGALYTLILLQREGRLIDFILEDIDSYEDSQIGAAVRRIHASCGKTLNEYFKIKKIIDTPEGTGYRVDGKLDRAKVRLVGNVPDMIPFEGIVQHGGWESTKIDLPERNDSVDVKVIFPAEVGF